MRTKYKPQPTREEPRKEFLKFRVNTEERARVEALAGKAGKRMSDYLRALVSLPALSPGAPLGNKNRAKTSS